MDKHRVHANPLGNPLYPRSRVKPPSHSSRFSKQSLQLHPGYRVPPFNSTSNIDISSFPNPGLIATTLPCVQMYILPGLSPANARLLIPAKILKERES
jgi:hypothetical protein